MGKSKKVAVDNQPILNLDEIAEMRQAYQIEYDKNEAKIAAIQPRQVQLRKLITDCDRVEDAIKALKDTLQVITSETKPKQEARSKPQGVSPIAGKILCTAFSQEKIPMSLKEVMPLAFGEKWETLRTGTRRSTNFIDDILLNEKGELPENSIIRTFLITAYERLCWISKSEIDHIDITPDLRRLWESIIRHYTLEEVKNTLIKWKVLKD